jgi:hypothetical protein
LRQYSGPFEVVERNSDLVYTIKDLKNPRRKKVVNVRRLKLFHEHQLPELNGTTDANDRIPQVPEVEANQELDNVEGFESDDADSEPVPLLEGEEESDDPPV